MLVLALGTFGGGCHRRPLGADCPSPTVVELLHDAVFHLDQRDDDARVRRDLVLVQQQLESDASGSSWARDFESRIQGVLDRDAGDRQFVAESIRADLHGSKCITADLHRRFHLALPLPPSAR